MDIEKEVSTYYVATEMANVAESLEKVTDSEDWEPLVEVSDAVMGGWLLKLAGRAKLHKYKKQATSRRRKPPEARKHNPKKPHVSVARLLATEHAKGV